MYKRGRAHWREGLLCGRGNTRLSASARSRYDGMMNARSSSREMMSIGDDVLDTYAAHDCLHVCWGVC